MYFIIAFLALISILLFLLYKKISTLIQIVNCQFVVSDHPDWAMTLLDWFKIIFERVENIAENTCNIDYALNYENPAGEDSAHSKRLESLLRLYSLKLVEKNSLSSKDALARAAFEFSKFDNSELIKKINGSYWDSSWNDRYQKKNLIEKSFLETGLLTKDCLDESLKLIPQDIFLSVWVLFKKYSSNLNVERMQFKIARDEKSYDEYVKNRAIVIKLLELGIIDKGISTRVKLKDLEGDFWLDWPCIKFVKSNLDEIKSIIYKGQNSHDDEHFEAKYRESKITHLFINYERMG